MKDITKERGKQYGDFKSTAAMSREIKNAMQQDDGFYVLAPTQQEALDMIAVKIARIVTGKDPSYVDNWDDIAGYANLISKELEKESEDNEQ